MAVEIGAIIGAALANGLFALLTTFMPPSQEAHIAGFLCGLSCGGFGASLGAAIGVTMVRRTRPHER